MILLVLVHRLNRDLRSMLHDVHANPTPTNTAADGLTSQVCSTLKSKRTECVVPDKLLSTCTPRLPACTEMLQSHAESMILMEH